MTLENEKLKLQLSDRERALSSIQRSMSLLEHRLSLLAGGSLDITDPRQHTSKGRDELDSVNHALRKIAREVCCLSLLLFYNLMFCCFVVSRKVKQSQ